MFKHDNFELIYKITDYPGEFLEASFTFQFCMHIWPVQLSWAKPKHDFIKKINPFPFTNFLDFYFYFDIFTNIQFYTSTVGTVFNS